MQGAVVYRPLVGPRQHGADDEALRGRTDVIEGIAGDQRQGARRRRVEHRDGFRINDPGSLDAIGLLSVGGLEFDHIALGDVFQPTEEPVPVAGNAGIAIRSRQCRVFDVPDGAIERAVVSARQHRHFEPEPRDPEHRERNGRVLAHRLAPRDDPLGRPQRLIRSAGPCRDILMRHETRHIEARRRGGPQVVRAPHHEPRDPEEPGRSLDEQKKAAQLHWHGVMRGPASGQEPSWYGCLAAERVPGGRIGGIRDFIGNLRGFGGWSAILRGRRSRPTGTPPEIP